jgi:membrane associated rhomboid family serine protease
MSFYRQGPYRTYGTSIGIPPLTPMVRAIMIACAAVWVAQLLLECVLRLVPLSQIFGLVPALVFQGGLWQPVTYLWLHSPVDPFHLLFNMLFLWILGGDLERHWGGRAFLRYYLVCGIGAGLFIALAGLFANPGVPTIGASGAIFGLILAYGMIFSERVILFMMIFPMKARTFAWVMFAVTFFYTFGHASSGISHIAHLGGMVVGYLYLKRAWRLGEFFQELRWRLRRRKFKVMPPRDDDRWVN